MSSRQRNRNNNPSRQLPRTDQQRGGSSKPHRQVESLGTDDESGTHSNGSTTKSQGWNGRLNPPGIQSKRRYKRQRAKEKYNLSEDEKKAKNSEAWKLLNPEQREQVHKNSQRRQEVQRWGENNKTRSEMINKEIAHYKSIGRLPDDKFLYLDAVNLDEPVHPDELEERYIWYGGAKVFRQAVRELEKRGEPKLVVNIDKEIQLVSGHKFVEKNREARDRAVQVLEHQLFDQEVEKLQKIGKLPMDEMELQEVKDRTFFRLKEAMQDYREDPELGRQYGVIEHDATEQMIDEFLGHNLRSIPPDSLLLKMGLQLPEDDMMDDMPFGDPRALKLIEKKMQNGTELSPRDLEHVYNSHLYKDIPFAEQRKQIEEIKREVMLEDSLQQEQARYGELRKEREDTQRLQLMLNQDHIAEDFPTLEELRQRRDETERRHKILIKEEKKFQHFDRDGTYLGQSPNDLQNRDSDSPIDTMIPKMTEARTLKDLRRMLDGPKTSRQGILSRMKDREETRRAYENAILNATDNDQLKPQTSPKEDRDPDKPLNAKQQRDIRKMLKNMDYKGPLSYLNEVKLNKFNNKDWRTNNPTSWKDIKDAILKDYFIDQERKNTYFDMDWEPEVANKHEVDRYNVPPLFTKLMPKVRLKRKPDWSGEELVKHGENIIDNLNDRLKAYNELNKEPTQREKMQAWMDHNHYEFPKAKDLDFRDPRWFERFYHKPHLEGGFEVFGDYENWITPEYSGSRKWHALHSHLSPEDKYLKRFQETYPDYEEFLDEQMALVAYNPDHLRASDSIGKFTNGLNKLSRHIDNKFQHEMMEISTFGEKGEDLKRFLYTANRQQIPLVDPKEFTMVREVIPNLSTNVLSPSEQETLEGAMVNTILARHNPLHPDYIARKQEYDWATTNQYGHVYNGTLETQRAEAEFQMKIDYRKINEENEATGEESKILEHRALFPGWYSPSSTSTQQDLQSEQLQVHSTNHPSQGQPPGISNYPLLSKEEKNTPNLKHANAPLHQLLQGPDKNPTFQPLLSPKVETYDHLQPEDLWVAPPNLQHDSEEKQEFKRLLKNQLDHDRDGEFKQGLLNNIKDYEKDTKYEQSARSYINQSIYSAALRDIDDFHPMTMKQHEDSTKYQNDLKETQRHDNFLKTNISEEEYNEYRLNYPWRKQFDPQQNEIVSNMLKEGLNKMAHGLSVLRKNQGEKSLLQSNLLQRSTQLNNAQLYIDSMNRRLDQQSSPGRRGKGHRQDNELMDNDYLNQPFFAQRSPSISQEQQQLSPKQRSQHRQIEHMNNLQQLKQDLLNDSIEHVERRKMQKVINYWMQDDASPERFKLVLDNLDELVDEFDTLPNRVIDVMENKANRATLLARFAPQHHDSKRGFGALTSNITRLPTTMTSPSLQHLEQYNNLQHPLLSGTLDEKRNLLGQQFDHESQYMGHYESVHHESERYNGITIEPNPYYQLEDTIDKYSKTPVEMMRRKDGQRKTFEQSLNTNNFSPLDDPPLLPQFNQSLENTSYGISRRDISRARDRNLSKQQGKLDQWHNQQHANRLLLRERLHGRSPSTSNALNERLRYEGGQMTLDPEKPKSSQQPPSQGIPQNLKTDQLTDKIYSNFHDFYTNQLKAGAIADRAPLDDLVQALSEEGQDRGVLQHPSVFINNALDTLFPSTTRSLSTLNLPDNLKFPHAAVKSLINTAQQQLAQSFARAKLRHLVAREQYFDQHDLAMEQQQLYDTMVQTRNNYVLQQRELMNYLNDKRNVHGLIFPNSQNESSGTRFNKTTINSVKNVLAQQLFDDIHDYYTKANHEEKELMDLTRDYGEYLGKNGQNVNNLLLSTTPDSPQPQIPSFLSQMLNKHRDTLIHLPSAVQQRRFIEDQIWSERSQYLASHLSNLPNKIVSSLLTLQSMAQHPHPGVVRREMEQRARVGNYLARLQNVLVDNTMTSLLGPHWRQQKSLNSQSRHQQRNSQPPQVTNFSQRYPHLSAPLVQQTLFSQFAWTNGLIGSLRQSIMGQWGNELMQLFRSPSSILPRHSPSPNRSHINDVNSPRGVRVERKIPLNIRNNNKTKRNSPTRRLRSFAILSDPSSQNQSSLQSLLRFSQHANNRAGLVPGISLRSKLLHSARELINSQQTAGQRRPKNKKVTLRNILIDPSPSQSLHNLMSIGELTRDTNQIVHNNTLWMQKRIMGTIGATTPDYGNSTTSLIETSSLLPPLPPHLPFQTQLQSAGGGDNNNNNNNNPPPPTTRTQMRDPFDNNKDNKHNSNALGDYVGAVSDNTKRVTNRKVEDLDPQMNENDSTNSRINDGFQEIRQSFARGFNKNWSDFITEAQERLYTEYLSSTNPVQ